MNGDEDLGAPTMESLMGGMGDMKVDAETLKLLEEMLGPMMQQ